MKIHLNNLIQTVTQAGKQLRYAFLDSKPIKQTLKDDGTIVTPFDLFCHDMIFEQISKDYPKCGFISEEKPIVEKDTPYYWILDPIDGTNNFANRLPHFCISLALLYKNQIEAAIIYDPIKDDLFTAQKGKGAFLNNQRIRIDGKSNNHFIGYSANDNQPGFPIRKMGSIALDFAYTACNRLGGCVTGKKVKLWDVAAGILIVQEAGGLVYNNGYDNTNFVEHDHLNLVAGSEKMASKLLNHIK